MKALVGLAVMAAVVVPPRVAGADDVDDLVAQGDDLARRAEYAQAIDKFKAADLKRPRALHACMIGLAYLRRDHWPQAEVFLGRCRKRAVASDPLPDWMDDAESQLKARLAAAPVTAVEIRVAPPGVAALVTISAFAPDESFDPQTIHLAAGRHTITVSAPGFTSVTRDITIPGSGTETIDITLLPVPEPRVEPPPPPPPPPVVDRPASGRARRWGNGLLIGAGGAAVGAIVLHALAYRERGKLDDARASGNGAAYNDHETAFDFERVGAISLYAVAGIAAGVGFYLRSVGRDVPAQISAAITHDAAFVTVGWSR